MKYYIIVLLLVGCNTFDTSNPIPEDVVDHSYGVDEMMWAEVFAPTSLPMEKHPLLAVFIDSLPSDSGTVTRGVFHSGDLALIQLVEVDEYDWGSCMDLRYVLAHEALHYLVWVHGMQHGEDPHDIPLVFIQHALDNRELATDYVEHKVYMEINYYCQDKWNVAPQD